MTATQTERVLRSFVPFAPTSDFVPLDCAIGVYVDVETTGLDPAVDQVIEVAMQPFAFDKNGVVRGVGEGRDWFRDPNIPIPAEITEITGITDAMVQGQSIDEEAVLSQLGGATLVIAHNAGFDRKMLEPILPAFKTLRWACSWKDVDWRKKFGASCGNLGHLLMDLHDQFFVAHRALNDCEAGIYLLGESKDDDGRTALSQLYAAMKTPTHRVWANDAPYGMKDELKLKRKYRWHDGATGHRKAWYFDGDAAAATAEGEWLRSQHVLPTTQTFTAVDRYSVRMDP